MSAARPRPSRRRLSSAMAHPCPRARRHRIWLGRSAETPYLPLQGGGRQHLPPPCAGANAVGWGSGPCRALLLIICRRQRTPTRLALLADLPLSGGDIAELAAPHRLSKA